VYNGQSTTFKRGTRTGGTQDRTKIDWFGVDVLNEYGDLAKSITALGGTRSSMFFAPVKWIISSDATIPSNITCRFPAGTTFYIEYGVTLTINGEIVAGDYEIFTGPGTLKGSASVASFNGVWIADSVINDILFVVIDTLVSLPDYNNQVVHEFPQRCLAQSTKWQGFI